MNTSLSFMSLIQSSSWNLLNWENKGMIVELITHLSDPHYLGTVEYNESIWRNILRIPDPQFLENSLKRSVRGRGLREQHDLLIVWNDVWKPELLKFFTLIDDVFIQNHPEFVHCKNRLWHPLCFVEHKTQFDLQPIHPSEEKPQKRSRLSSKIQKKDKTLSIDPTWDFPVLTYTVSTFRYCWDEPMNSTSRKDFWMTGVQLLAIPNDKKSEQDARTLIGKWIKLYGEKQTAAAIAQVSIRQSLPGDPKAFLTKILQSHQKGSTAVEKANMSRSKIQL